jgi:hypothetical protein
MIIENRFENNDAIVISYNAVTKQLVLYKYGNGTSRVLTHNERICLAELCLLGLGAVVTTFSIQEKQQ